MDNRQQKTERWETATRGPGFTHREVKLKCRLMLSLNGRDGDQSAQLPRWLELASKLEGRRHLHQDGVGMAEDAQGTSKMSPDISTYPEGFLYLGRHRTAPGQEKHPPKIEERGCHRTER